ncbi:NitT/TauT family transport system permease protein [Tardiphaga robiniae]|uniref:ABC transporter permease n=1 Tax=Tardiphaga robiniae TaxID=943830 RepID=UPI0028679A5C|nr:ABC transporter permease [Tardiphaga robiniae]MDR6661202.1 NitT/TauT family transport system permease protein [Tardiphaga robiniae]
MNGIVNNSELAPTNAASARAPLPALSRSTRLGALRGQARLVVLPVIAAALVITGWEAVVRIKQIPNTLLPAPSAVAIRLTETLPFLLGQAVPTTLETIASFLISMVLGISLAVLICKSRLMRDALYPNIVLFQLIPKIALAPLFIVWLGIGSTSRITFGVFISFFPVVVATLTGLMSVDRDLLRLCKAVGADESRIYAKVRFPAAVPHLFSGLKIAITFAMIGVIVGEFITAQAGLGYMILFAASQAEMTLIFASIVVLCVIGLVLYGIIVMAEALALKKYGA